MTTNYIKIPKKHTMQTKLQNTNKILGLIFLLIANLAFNKANSQTELISNGTFSSSGSWSTSQGFGYGSTYTSCNSCPGYAYAISTSGSYQTYMNAYLEQTLSIPSNTSSATLSFNVSNSLNGSTSGSERLFVYIYDISSGNTTTIANIYFNSNNGYTYYYYSVPSNLFGKQVIVGFNAKSGSTGLICRVDDVSLKQTTSGGGGSGTQNAPTNFSATAAGTDKILLSWTEPSGAYKYDFYDCNGSYIGYYNAPANSVYVNNLQSSTFYSFKMTCTNISGVVSNFTSCAGATTQKTSTPPNSPTNLTATPLSSSSIQLNWSAVTGAIGYNIYSCNGTFIKFISSNSATIDLLSPNTYYSYKIDAQNAESQTSPQTSCVGGTTLNSTLNTPTGLVATPIDNNSISLTWNTVSNATNYAIYDCNGIYIKDVTSNSSIIGGLTENTYYSFKLRAYNLQINSPVSICAGATTKKSNSNQLADMIVSSVSTSVKYATTGSSLTIYFTVKNIGNSNARSFINSVHFSTDNVFNAGQDIWLGENEIESLNPQSEKSSSIFITLPKNLNNKNYYLFISSDGANQTNENNENNNQNYSSIAVKGCNEITNTYPFSLPNNWNCNDFNNNQPVDPWNFYKWQCVSYVAWKINEMNGDLDITNNKLHFFENNFKQLGTTLSNAEQWDNVLSKFYQINFIPAVGAIAHWGAKENGTGENGHVAFVECVDGNIVTLSDYNWDACRYRVFQIDVTKPYNSNTNNLPKRFIHTEVGGYGSSILSSKETLNIPNFTLYPNPAKDKLILESSNPLDDFSKIRIFNTLGQEQELVIDSKNNQNWMIDISRLRDGIYYLSINGVAQRFVVQH